MPIRRILRIDDAADRKILKAHCRPIKLPDPKLKALVADMFETMHAAQGVGLAAPQIGLPIQLTIIELPPVYATDEQGNELDALIEAAQPYVLINPRIVKLADESVNRYEGCLSLPGWYGEVPRAPWATVEYQDIQGKRHRLRRAGGLLGHALQHEIDHLHGILFTERLVDLSTLRNVQDEHAELPNLNLDQPAEPAA